METGARLTVLYFPHIRPGPPGDFHSLFLYLSAHPAPSPPKPSTQTAWLSLSCAGRSNYCPRQGAGIRQACHSLAIISSSVPYSYFHLFIMLISPQLLDCWCLCSTCSSIQSSSHQQTSCVVESTPSCLVLISCCLDQPSKSSWHFVTIDYRLDKVDSKTSAYLS